MLPLLQNEKCVTSNVLLDTSFSNQLHSFSCIFGVVAFHDPHSAPWLFSPASRFWDESCLHVDGGGLQPGTPGQWHPVLPSVHSRSHHLSSGCERASHLPSQPQDDPFWGGCASRDHTYRICSPRPWPLHPPDCQVQCLFLHLSSKKSCLFLLCHSWTVQRNCWETIYLQLYHKLIVNSIRANGNISIHLLSSCISSNQAPISPIFAFLFLYTHINIHTGITDSGHGAIQTSNLGCTNSLLPIKV